jgi:hypothetical protein
MTLDTVGKPISWEEANVAVGFVPGLYSWSISAAAAITERIAGTRFLCALDYREFAERGEEYLASVWPPEWYRLQKSMSTQGFSREQEAARRFIRSGILEVKKIGPDDLESLLRRNLVICLINVAKTKGQVGEIAHFVLLYDAPMGQFRYHDPGLPPIKAASLDRASFMQAFEGSEAIAVPDLRLNLQTAR